MSFTFYTLAPSESPRNLTVQYSTPSATTLQWKPVHKYFINGRLRGYKVKYKETLSTPLSDWSFIVINANGTQQSRNKRSVQEEEIVSFNLEGLKACTSYTVIVLAFTIKDGVPTLAKNFTTAEMGRFCWDWLINWLVDLTDSCAVSERVGEWLSDSLIQSTLALWTPRYNGHPDYTDSSKNKPH